jgi:purine-binding chemotaxis protein CheW
MTDAIQYLMLGIDHEIFGIDNRNMREILETLPVSKLPRSRSC